MGHDGDKVAEEARQVIEQCNDEVDDDGIDSLINNGNVGCAGDDRGRTV